MVDELGPHLQLCDADETPRADFSLDKNGPSIRLLGKGQQVAHGHLGIRGRDRRAHV